MTACPAVVTVLVVTVGTLDWGQGISAAPAGSPGGLQAAILLAELDQEFAPFGFVAVHDRWHLQARESPVGGFGPRPCRLPVPMLSPVLR